MNGFENANGATRGIAVLVTHIVFILLVVRLYELLAEVDQPQAMPMVRFVSIGVAAALANLLTRFGPLPFLSGADSMAAFSKPQLDALAMASLRSRASAATVPLAFW